MAQNFVVDIYTGEWHHSDNFRIVSVEDDYLHTFVALTQNQRMELAANNGARIPKGEQ
jgi:hypothetical protein